MKTPNEMLDDVLKLVGNGELPDEVYEVIAYLVHRVKDLSSELFHLRNGWEWNP